MGHSAGCPVWQSQRHWRGRRLSAGAVLSPFGLSCALQGQHLHCLESSERAWGKRQNSAAHSCSRLFDFSPDGHWLLLAQIEMNASPDPIVVLLKQHEFVNVLAGHHGVVLGMMFSLDGNKVA